MALIEVVPGGYERGGPDDTLVTRDVFTCLAIAARIRRRGAGYMGHYLTTGLEPDTVIERANEVTDAAASEAGSRQRVSIWLTGCAPMDIEFPETRECRERVGPQLRADGFERVRELWLPTDEYAINQATLDIPNARFRAPFVHMSSWPPE